MKILAVAHSYVVDSNRQFWNQTAIESGAEVELILPKEWKSNLFKSNIFAYNESTDNYLKAIHPINVLNNGNGSFYFYKWNDLYRVLRSKKYDAIFVFQETWAFSLAQIVLLKIFTKNRSTPVEIAVCQNIIKPKLSLIIPFERLLMLFIKRIWFCTYEIENVLDWKGIHNSRSYLPFTFDQDLYSPKIKKISDKIKIGFIGRISEEKGILTLIEACKILIQRGFSIELHLAGGGDLVESLKMNNENFIVLHGLIPHREAHLFYHKIDILVLPSKTKQFWKEQFGRVLVEATAAGTPVVGSSSGAIPEVISKIGFGRVFKENDEVDLAKEITKIISLMNEEGYVEMMEQAISRTIEFAGHRSVGKKLVEQMEDDA